MAYLKQFLSLILVAAGLFGFYFFKNYDGYSIPYPFLWMICSIGLGLTGVLLSFRISKKGYKTIIENYNEEIKQFKAKSEKIVVDMDKCEFANTGYFKEVNEDRHSWMSKVLFVEEIRHTEHIQQSGLIYQNNTSNGIEKFYSPSFPFDKTTLQYYVISKKVKLYVDRFNRSNYFFEVEK